MNITEILKDGITVSDVLRNLKQREKKFLNGMTFAERGTIIRGLFPQLVEKKISQADNSLQGRMILPGCSSLHFIGEPVKWHENIFDYDEYTYQLNRMDQWRFLAEAYSYTGDRRYAEKIIAEFYHWIDDCPVQPLYRENGELAVEDFDGCACNQGIWRSLEAGIRMYRTWPLVIHHLISGGFITEQFLETYLLSAYEHAQILYLVAPKLWPDADHNHYLMENNGLLYLASMFPEFKDAELWQKHALHEMDRCMMAQVTEEGGQIEGCASYHNGSAYWLCLPLLLSEKYGFAVSEAYKERLGRMVEYAAHATRPCGGNSSWGDSHTYSSTLAAGAFCHYMVFKDPSYLENAHYYYSMEKLMADMGVHIWEVPDLYDLHHQIERITNIKKMPQLPVTSWQKQLKQVFLRTDWSNDALYVMFACRTPIQNNHAHIDPAGFEFTAYGRCLLGDPSIYYYKDDENRKNLKSAHWHNCLTLNHENPWEYISSWQYGPQQHGDILAVENTDRLIYSIAQHANYMPTMHKRAVAIVDQQFLLVLDILDQVALDTSVQINFHMDAPQALVNTENCFARSLSKEANVSVYSDENLKPSLVPAKISTKNDVWHDTVIARFEAEHVSEGQQAFVCIAMPSRAGEEPQQVTEITKALSADGTVRISFCVSGKKYEITLSDNRLYV
ncbi:heparinase II/III family protein [Lacrimispora brassicae]